LKGRTTKDISRIIGTGTCFTEAFLPAARSICPTSWLNVRFSGPPTARIVRLSCLR